MHIFHRLILSLLFLVACKSDFSTPTIPVQDIATTQPPVLSSATSSARLVKASGPQVYRLENGRLRHISDWATFFAFGYQSNQITELSKKDLNYTLDAPLTRWITSDSDANLYLLKQGQRYRVPDLKAMEAIGSSPLDVSLVSNELLASFKLAPAPLALEDWALQDKPKTTAALWANGFLWLAKADGTLTRWDANTGQSAEQNLPGHPIVHALASDGQIVYAGTEGGTIWQIASKSDYTQTVSGQASWISSITIDSDKRLWFADVSHWDQTASHYQTGRGVIQLGTGTAQVLPHVADDQTTSSLSTVTALTLDAKNAALWIGTRFGGVWRYDLNTGDGQSYNTFNSGLKDNHIFGLKQAPDGTVWAGTGYGVSLYHNGVWQNDDFAEVFKDKGPSARALAIATNNTIWVAGSTYLARHAPNQSWQIYSAIDYPLLADQFDFVVLDNREQPWFIGKKHIVHWDGVSWIAFDLQMHNLGKFVDGQSLAGATPPPLNFPSPTAQYTDWLKKWPRPENDNGRGVHFTTAFWFDEFDVRRQVARMKRIGMRWVLFPSVTREQLIRTAPIFKEAGIMVVWRPLVKPYQSYDYWAEDVQYLRRLGLPPYIQLYNEPTLEQEWDGGKPDQEVYLRYLLPALQQVYQAGGYIGLQSIDPDELHAVLQRMKAEGMSQMFNRLFFVPHLYGANHPPEYTQDIIGVLGFREYARVFQQELGFVPIMIAGEGGWRLGEAQDNRYPTISESLHRDYTIAVFDWFRAGRLSNDELLPDYFLAFVRG